MSETLTREQIISRAKAEPHKRSFSIERAVRADGDDAASRTVELSFASDTPCTHFSWAQFDYVDIKLSMDKKAMRSDRLRNGAPLLADHNPADQIGVVEKFTVEAAEGKARAVVRFSQSQRGEEIYRDVVDGIRRNVSVGFSIHKLVLEEENEDGNDLYRADDWEPFELSIVSIPADISVGVGRGAEFAKPQITNPEPELKQTMKDNVQPETPAQDTPEVQTRAAQEARTVEDLNNQIKFGATFGFEKEVREAALANPEFTMSDARMLVQQLKAKSDDVQKRVKPVERSADDAHSLSAAFTRSNEYKSMERGRGRKLNFVVETPLRADELLQRATYSGSGDGLTGYDKQPGIVTIGSQMPTVADLFMQAETDSPTVRYTKETSYTNSATFVTEGAAKPEASFVLEEADAPVRKAAVYTKVTDETLEDHAQIRPYLDTRLTLMLRQEIDDVLLNGNGTPPNLTGLLSTSGILTQEMASNTAQTLAEAIFNAITKVRAESFFEPDGIVIHPNDYAKLRLAKDANNQYFGGGFFTGQYGNAGYGDPSTLWGLRVVQTTAIEEINIATPGAGVAGPLVGAFKLGGVVYYRNGISIEATNTDQDDFIKNLTTIRVEQRLALAILRPAAFCQVINAA